MRRGTGKANWVVGCGAVQRGRGEAEQDSRVGMGKPVNGAEAWGAGGMGSTMINVES